MPSWVCLFQNSGVMERLSIKIRFLFPCCEIAQGDKQKACTMLRSDKMIWASQLAECDMQSDNTPTNVWNKWTQTFAQILSTKLPTKHKYLFHTLPLNFVYPFGKWACASERWVCPCVSDFLHKFLLCVVSTYNLPKILFKTKGSSQIAAHVMLVSSSSSRRFYRVASSKLLLLRIKPCARARAQKPFSQSQSNYSNRKFTLSRAVVLSIKYVHD